MAKMILSPPPSLPSNGTSSSSSSTQQENNTNTNFPYSSYYKSKPPDHLLSIPITITEENNYKLRNNIYRMTKVIIILWVCSLLLILRHPIILPPVTAAEIIPSTILPLPNQLISVILVNHSRPRMIQESSLMSTLIGHPNIGEIILLHANPKTRFEYVHDKVVNIDATNENDEMGLSLRFFFCQYAKYEWVIQVDDDMEVSWGAINKLMTEFERDPNRIVGRYGRQLVNSQWFHGYSSADTNRETEVVLTKFMILQRDICTSFFHYAPLVWEDVLEGEGPLWNGEDIFMSLVAQHVYKQKNYAISWLDVRDAPENLKDYDNGRLDISGGYQPSFRIWDWHWWHSLLRRNRHYDYRGRLWRIAKERLSKTDHDESDI